MSDVDWAGSPLKVITVDQADLTFDRVEPVSGLDVYTFDLNVFHLDLRSHEADRGPLGMGGGVAWPTTHTHNTQELLAGVLYARIIRINPPYVVTFEDLPYAVEFVGANTNIHEVTTVNQVQIRPNNSAGLQIVETGISGLTAAESAALLLVSELLESDQFYDKNTDLMHYYRKGTTTDLIPPKGVTGAITTGDVSLIE